LTFRYGKGDHHSVFGVFLVEDDKSTVYHKMQGAGARECIMKDIVRMSEWVKLPV
jgi:hypothetical protein